STMRTYVSSELGKWLEDNGIRHIRGRPYHPMTQGKIERCSDSRECREPSTLSHLGFQQVQKTPTIHVSSGFIWGIPVEGSGAWVIENSSTQSLSRSQLPRWRRCRTTRKS